jgi:anthranilate phosphoribosyltransferase
LCAGTDLTREVAAAAMTSVLSGEATPAQIAGFAVALRIKGETVEEMTGLVTAMLAAGSPVVIDPALVVIDTCGTGGDRSGTINVSTVAALVAAGAGARVCKHGNRAATSQAGSADVLEALGVALDLSGEAVARCVEEVGMGFCFAPRFHPAMRHAGPVRGQLGVPTVFNFLGPLANPARVRRQIVGVSDPRMAERVLGVLQANGAERAMVVYGDDGLDELTTTGPSNVLELVDGSVRQYSLDPASLGLGGGTRHGLRGGDAAANASRVRAILAGEAGPQRDIALLNASAALQIAGIVSSWDEGVRAAAASIDSGAASAVLEGLVRVSSSASSSSSPSDDGA